MPILDMPEPTRYGKRARTVSPTRERKKTKKKKRPELPTRRQERDKECSDTPAPEARQGELHLSHLVTQVHLILP